MLGKVSIAAGTLLAASGTTIAVLTSPVGATTSASHHTLHVTAKRAAEVQYAKGGFTEADKLRSKSGKTLGTAVSDCTPVSATKAHCTGVAGLDGGLLDSHFSLNFATGAIWGAPKLPDSPSNRMDVWKGEVIASTEEELLTGIQR